MDLFSIEHGEAAYRADFVVYGTSVAALAAVLVVATPAAHWLEATCLVAAGWVGWTAVEYLLHRFVLHGIAPFRHWHEEHHRRPTALICTPTIFSASLIVVLVFLPAMAVGGVWQGCALTLGVVSGYLLYAVTHHAMHHWRSESAWMARRKRSHALHHHAAHRGGYGVTSGFWDRLLGSTVAPGQVPKAGSRR